jgi:mRNA interferase MazF
VTWPMSRAEAPRRGEVWWVVFDASLGGEIRKTRPAVIVSNDIANRVLNRVKMVPVTSNVSRLYPSEAYITVAGARSKAMADQLATVSKARLRECIARIGAEELTAIERAIRVQLQL